MLEIQQYKVIIYIYSKQLMMLSQNLTYLINKSGIKQYKIAEIFDVSQGQMSSYVSGSAPKLHTIIRMSEYFRVSIDDLLMANLEELYPKKYVVGLDQGSFDEPKPEGSYIKVKPSLKDKQYQNIDARVNALVNEKLNAYTQSLEVLDDKISNNSKRIKNLEKNQLKKTN